MAMMAAAAARFGADSGIDIDPSEFIGDVSVAGSPRTRCFTLLLAGFADVGHGRLAEAAGWFRAAFAGCDPAGDVDLISNLGIAAMHLGEDAVVLDRYGRLVAQA